MWNPGDDAIVSIDGGKFPGEVLKIEHSGFALCKIHIDPEWDFGRASPRVMPEQIVAVRISKLERVEEKVA
jgi:hypothetical protein